MKTQTILFYNPHTEAEIGRWVRVTDDDHDEVTADLAVQDVLQAAHRRGDDVPALWGRYSSWSNGYVASRLEGSPEVSAPAG